MHFKFKTPCGKFLVKLGNFQLDFFLFNINVKHVHMQTFSMIKIMNTSSASWHFFFKHWNDWDWASLCGVTVNESYTFCSLNKLWLGWDGSRRILLALFSPNSLQCLPGWAGSWWFLCVCVCVPIFWPLQGFSDFYCAASIPHYNAICQHTLNCGTVERLHQVCLQMTLQQNSLDLAEQRTFWAIHTQHHSKKKPKTNKWTNK